MSIPFIDNLNVMNMTPHPIKIIDRRMTYINRNNKVFLDEEVTEREAVSTVVPTSGISLSVQEDDSIPDTIGSFQLYSQMGNARFNQVIPKSIINNCDVIIVSNMCARLLLTMSNSIISGTNQNPQFSLFDIDKFYVPKLVVYKNLMYGKNMPIGAIGIQQVTPTLSIEAYASMLKVNNMAEYPAAIPISAASAYKSYKAAITAGMQRNKALIAVEEYLEKREIL
jgi:hypothetical protein